MQTSLDMETTECPNCFMPFGVTSRFIEDRKKDGKEFYCPSGHVQSFTNSYNTRLKKKLQAAIAREQLERDQRHAAELAVQREMEARVKAEESKARTERRVKNGVCPCCKRSFCNVQRHIKTKHPEFATK